MFKNYCENMAHSGIHIQQAKHNTNFFKKIENFFFYDWIITVIFYIALQYVDHFLDYFLKEHPNTHQDRDDLLKMNDKFFSKNFFISYKSLKNLSEMARYQPDKWQNIIDANKISKSLVDLENIKNRIP